MTNWTEMSEVGCLKELRRRVEPSSVRAIETAASDPARVHVASQAFCRVMLRALTALLAGSILFKVIIPFLLIMMTCSAIYKILPHAPVSWRNALIGGGITALLWEAAKHLFTWYAAESLTLGGIYGSLSTIILFLLWIFYSAAILLFGAEIVHKME